MLIIIRTKLSNNKIDLYDSVREISSAHSSSAPVEEVKCFEKRSGRHDAKSTTLNLPGSLLKKLGHVFP